MVLLCCGVSEARTHAEAAGAQGEPDATDIDAGAQKIFDGVQQVKCGS
jgi:hypothetical protein